MARQPRWNLPATGAYHVTNRGVELRSIYADDADRELFVGLLERAARRFGWQLCAYALMTNHFHVVLVAQLDRLSRGMHFLSFRYAQAFNESHGRSGHLFQGRFGARAIEGDDYLASACTYVFQNPVRAGICDDAGDYPWLGGEFL